MQRLHGKAILAQHATADGVIIEHRDRSQPSWRQLAERRPKVPYYPLLRSRFAFARARLTNGASIAACPFPLSNALVDVCMAATFSAVMRQYSAGEQVP